MHKKSSLSCKTCSFPASHEKICFYVIALMNSISPLRRCGCVSALRILGLTVMCSINIIVLCFVKNVSETELAGAHENPLAR